MTLPEIALRASRYGIEVSLQSKSKPEAGVVGPLCDGAV